MFNTLGSFSAVYFALAAVLFILILFEKHFIQLEENLKAKKTKSKQTVRQNARKSTAQKNKSNIVSSKNKTACVRRIPNNAA